MLENEKKEEAQKAWSSPDETSRSVALIVTTDLCCRLFNVKQGRPSWGINEGGIDFIGYVLDTWEDPQPRLAVSGRPQDRVRSYPQCTASRLTFSTHIHYSKFSILVGNYFEFLRMHYMLLPKGMPTAVPKTYSLGVRIWLKWSQVVLGYLSHLSIFSSSINLNYKI